MIGLSATRAAAAFSERFANSMGVRGAIRAMIAANFMAPKARIAPINAEIGEQK
jgi:hypothetical protein